MLFNSTLFIFIFLPVTLIGFYALGSLAGRRWAMLWLMLASLTFYGWWNPRYLVLIGASILFNHLVACGLTRLSLARRRPLLTVGIAGNLGLLGYFKYAHFFASALRSFTGIGLVSPQVVLPLGISFFTFTQIVYLVDAYRNVTGGYRLRDYALFVTYFPHLIAGPIVHHWQIMPQFQSSRERFRWNNFAVGITIFCLGLSQKVLIADTVAPIASNLFNMARDGYPLPFFQAWLAAFAYAVQIYFDFAGYSNMALGLSKMFGIKLPLNFNSPYQATSVIDFWRRWHITLSEFLRSYLYIPLGGNRKGKARRYANLMTTMLLGGLWHGAGWTFVLWGGLHGIFLAVNHAWRDTRKSLGIDTSREATFAVRLLGGIITYLCVVTAWVFFRADSFAAALNILHGMTTWHRGHETIWSRADYGTVAAFMLLAWLAPNVQQWMANYEPALETTPPVSRFQWRPSVAHGLVTGVLFYFAVKTLFSAAPSQFLYYNF